MNTPRNTQQSLNELLSTDRTSLKVPGKRKEKVVLVAEDDDNNFYIINNILNLLNLNVIRAFNGQEAVFLCKSESIDLVLMDIKMPVMDGFTATRLIIKAKPTQKIIIQTAFSEDRDYAFLCGCIGFIEKPFNKQQLISLVSSYL